MEHKLTQIMKMSLAILDSFLSLVDCNIPLKATKRTYVALSVT